MKKMELTISSLMRPNIRSLVPYSSARDEFKGEAKVFLDANENAYTPSPLEPGLNRYPDPVQIELKAKISKIKGVPAKNIFLGNGSDEAIDILYRVFCEPGRDKVIIVPPTYGMYEVSANINDVEVVKVPLTDQFQLDVETIVGTEAKLLFLCSPNNPTGNSLRGEDVIKVLDSFTGIVVIDEAYINFAKQKSFITELVKFPNLVVLQTFSKAWGMAGVRLGMAFAGEEIISAFNKVKPPYNVGVLPQQAVLKALDGLAEVNGWIKEIVAERNKLSMALQALPFVEKVFPSDANFLLIRVIGPKKIYEYLAGKGIIVRDRSKVNGCEGCLRITVGAPAENRLLIETLKNYESN